MVEIDTEDRVTIGGIRRVLILLALDQSGIPLEGVAEVVREGGFSLSFIETAGYDVFAPLDERTFEEVSAETGVPHELLAAIREVMGGTPPRPDDLARQDELAVLPLLQLQLGEGMRPKVLERALRVYGDSLRRISETEAEWWRTEIVDRFYAAGKTERDIAAFAREFSPRMSTVSDAAILAIYHAQQRLAWSANIISGFASALVRAGLHTRTEHPPVMCFLDISGYTRLTQEQGDTAAADVAEKVARLVQRTAVSHGGRPVKWLGDGVMLYFPDPAQGVSACLQTLEGVIEDGLPPAHVGLHAGPVVFQEGDYYGQTVNVAARIGEYARPGEMLVSQQVVDAAGDLEMVGFREIGPVELKGLSEPIRLYQAVRPD